MALRCGIVGLPNAGKSTLFNALTASSVPAESYPFCTVEPHHGVVAVPDLRLAALESCVGSGSVVPATVEFVDIAGLVPGASRGEGLGNRFLAHIRESHVLCHLVRCFDDPDVGHVAGKVDPRADAETVETELALADLETVGRRLERARRSAKSGDAQAHAEAEFFAALTTSLSEGRPARSHDVPAACERAFADSQLLTAKPQVLLANVDEAALVGSSPHAESLEAHARQVGAPVLRLCAKIEAELAQLDPDERTAFLVELGLGTTGLQRLVACVYDLLDRVTFFTVTGGKQVHAWAVRRGTPVQQAAGEVHGDFERSFVRAEVVGWEDFVAAGGEAAARAAGTLRVEGRDYPVADGDVIRFRANP